MVNLYWLLFLLAVLPVFPLLWIGWKKKRLWWLCLVPCLALMLYTRLEISARYRSAHLIQNAAAVCLVCEAREADFPFLPGGYEIPFEALFGDNEAFLSWKNTFQKWYTDRIDFMQNLTPSSYTILEQTQFNGLTLTTIAFTFPPGSPLYDKPAGGILAIPDNFIIGNLPIVAIHGHEERTWGQFPLDLFLEQKWPFELAQNGYIVWTPVSMYHTEIVDYGETFGYPLVWAKIISEGMDYLINEQILHTPEIGWIVTGLSSGAQTGYVLMAYRSDISSGIFAGTEHNLDFLRREYRITGHPNCWDIEGINAFSAIMALIPPRPMQFQTGRGDPFFPHGRALEKQGDWFSGTNRGQHSTEIGGEFLAVRSIYAMFNKENHFSVMIHDGGHEFHVKEALAFIDKFKN
jgi:hypothetical protein